MIRRNDVEPHKNIRKETEMSLLEQINSPWRRIPQFSRCSVAFYESNLKHDHKESLRKIYKRARLDPTLGAF